MRVFSAKSWYLMILPGNDVVELVKFPFLIGASQQCDFVVSAQDIPAPQILIVNEVKRHLSIVSQDGPIVFGRQAAHYAKITRRQGKGRISCGRLTMLFMYTSESELSDLQQRLGVAGMTEGNAIGSNLPIAKAVPPPLPTASSSETIMADDSWCYVHDGKTHGPMSEEDFVKAVRMDSVWHNDEVWLEGDPSSSLAEDVDGLEFPKWYYEHQGQVQGPVDRRTLARLACEGHLCRTDPLWPEKGNGDRFAAATFPGLAFAEIWPVGGNHLEVDGKIVCPYCWGHFGAEHILYIAAHPELRGDPLLGANEFMRFSPTIITPEGHARDPKGMESRHIACPHCHMQLPFNIVDTDLVIYSMAGTMAAGKTVYLASLLNVLELDINHMLPFYFSDVDTQVNVQLKNYSQKLLAGEPIDRTAMVDHAVEIVRDGFASHLPLPYIFNLESFGGENGNNRNLLALYDNAGEHWQIGNDRPDHPGTGHVSLAEGMLFIFDPTRDVGIRRAMEEKGTIFESGEIDNQREILMEMIQRFRSRLGLIGAETYEYPLIICIAKSDLLRDFFDLEEPPWVVDEHSGSIVLDIAKLVRMSYRARSFLIRQRGPSRNLVIDAERFASHVLYIPVSAFGVSPQVRVDAEGNRHFRIEEAVPPPGEITPKWVEVPFLYLLSRKGYLDKTYDSSEDCLEGRVVSQHGRLFRVKVDGIDSILTVPEAYGGYVLDDFESGRSFKTPATENQLV